MTSPLPANTSQTARLMADPPGFAVGWQTPVYVASPPAGSGFTYTVDGRYFERLLAAQFTLNTSATVLNRFLHLELNDQDGTRVSEVQASGAVAASAMITTFLTVGAGVLATGSTGHTYGALPDLLIPPGWSWQVPTVGLDPADQVSGVVLLVQRFPNDAAATVAGQ